MVTALMFATVFLPPFILLDHFPNIGLFLQATAIQSVNSDKVEVLNLPRVVKNHTPLVYVPLQSTSIASSVVLSILYSQCISDSAFVLSNVSLSQMFASAGERICSQLH